MAAAYYGAARLGLGLSLVGESVTPLWPPTGLALVALLAYGTRMWPAVAVAAFAVNLPISPSPAAAAGIAVGNTLAPLAAAALLARAGFRRELERVRDALLIVLAAALLSMLISATIGTTSLALSGAISKQRFWETWWVWWTGDAMGVLIVAPFLWPLWPLRRVSMRPVRILEALVLFAGVGAAAALAVRTDGTVLFVVLPLLGIVAWRFQQPGAGPAGLLASTIVIWAAVQEAGAFAGKSLTDKMVVLQTFNAAVAFTSFFFAAAVAEKMRIREALERATGRLEETVKRRTSELTAANEQLVEEIAERAQAQMFLQQREMQLAEAQAVAHVGSWEWDIPEDRIGCSDELMRILGIDSGEFVPTFEGFLERVHSEDRSTFRSAVERALADAADFALEHRILRPDGSERTVHARGSVIVDASGDPVRMVGTGQDVTERSLAERALRESESRFRTVFESAAIGMAQCDAGGRFLKVNLALQKLLGYSEHHLAGLSLLETTHADDRRRNSDLFERLLRGQISAFDIEKRLVRGDGSVVWIHDSVSLVRDDSGTPKFVHSIVQDLTERRRAEALQRAEAERSRLRELFSEVPAVVFVTRGPQHVVEFANDAFRDLVGSRGAAGKPLGEAVPEMEQQGHVALIDRVFATGVAYAASEALLTIGGGSESVEERFFNLVYQPVRAHDGTVEGVLAHAVDVTETIRGRERVTESLAFLDTLLTTAPAGFAVFDSDLRYVRINERLAAINELPVQEHLGRTLQEVAPSFAETLEPALRRVLETGEPVVDVEFSRSARGLPEERHYLASYYPVLTAEGASLGVGMVVVDITERKGFERLLAGQKEVLELVARGADQAEVLTALARTAEEQSAGGVLASILLADESATRLRLGAAPSLPQAFVRAIDGTVIGRSTDSCGEAAYRREPVLVADIATDPRWSALRNLAVGHGLRAAWSWPILTADGMVLGTFCLYCTHPRLPTGRERELLDVLARTAAIAIERERDEQQRRALVEREREAQARLYQREHLVAETLQRSLLPERLPETPGVLVAARYIPASADVEVGGDWYDVVPLPGGRLGLAIGDVVGHGIAAAAAMGQMRMALRAYALEDLAPAEALGRLNRLLFELQPGAMSTVLYGQFDPGTGDVRFASAGHPPPLVLRGVDGSEYLRGGLAPPLGVSLSMEYTEAGTRIEAGSTLLLYTDGLVEKRREPIDDGLVLLEKAARTAPDDLEAACDHVLASLLDAGVSDDVALIALRALSFAGEDLRLTRPAVPGSVPELRRVLQRWLSQNGAAGEDANDILVAFSEACTNVVQHAYGPGGGPLEVEASLHGPEVLLTVRDYGSWRSPSSVPPEDGGLGLELMQSLMEAVDVASGADGTEVRMRRRLGVLAGHG